MRVGTSIRRPSVSISCALGLTGFAVVAMVAGCAATSQSVVSQVDQRDSASSSPTGEASSSESVPDAANSPKQAGGPTDRKALAVDFGLASICRPNPTVVRLQIRNDTSEPEPFTLVNYGGGTPPQNGVARSGELVVDVASESVDQEWTLKIAGYRIAARVGDVALCG